MRWLSRLNTRLWFNCLPSNFPCPSNAMSCTESVCPFRVLSYSPVSKSHTFIVASSEADTIMLKMGWKITRLTVARWPDSLNFSGWRGIHSVGVRLAFVGAPSINSFSVSLSFDSSSITFFCNRMTDVHFFSNKPRYFRSISCGTSASRRKTSSASL